MEIQSPTQTNVALSGNFWEWMNLMMISLMCKGRKEEETRVGQKWVKMGIQELRQWKGNVQSVMVLIELNCVMDFLAWLLMIVPNFVRIRAFVSSVYYLGILQKNVPLRKDVEYAMDITILCSMEWILHGPQEWVLYQHKEATINMGQGGAIASSSVPSS